MPERPPPPSDDDSDRGSPEPDEGRDEADPVDPRTLFETLDLLPQHLALMTPAGEVVHLNRWLVELLRRIPRGRYLEEALGGLARTIAGAGPSRNTEGRTGPPPMIEFSTAAGTFLLWGWCVELGRYGLGRLVLMTVQPVRPDLPPDDVLRERFGLTPREIDVARLLAEGWSNAGIAVALCISPYTAQHHTEKVMRKLGVHSRGEVGPTLRRPAQDTRPKSDPTRHKGGSSRRKVPSDAVLRDRVGLTPEEIDVVRLLAEGRSEAEIAAALRISPDLARRHTEKVMRKLGVRSRGEVGPKLRELGEDTGP